jgi:hypothetical protein
LMLIWLCCWSWLPPPPWVVPAPPGLLLSPWFSLQLWLWSWYWSPKWLPGKDLWFWLLNWSWFSCGSWGVLAVLTTGMELRVCFSETKAKWFGWLWCPCFYSTELLSVVSTAMPCKLVSVLLKDGPHLCMWPSWFSLPASARHGRACA